MTDKPIPGIDRSFTRAEQEAEARRYRRYREEKGDYRSDDQLYLDHALGNLQSDIDTTIADLKDNLASNEQTEILRRIERRIRFIGMMIIVSIAVIVIDYTETILPGGWGIGKELAGWISVAIGGTLGFFLQWRFDHR